MTRLIRNINAFMAGLLIIFAFAYCAEASGTDRHVTAGDTTIGDTLVGGSDSIGIGFGMGDVDIAQCMYTKGTPVYQWGKYNKWCMADSLDSRGLHEAAAKLRCDVKEYRKIFESADECLKLSLMKTFHVEPMVEPAKDDDEDAHELEAVYARISDLEAKATQPIQIPEQSPPQVIERTLIEQVPLFSADKRAKLLAVKNE